MTWALCAIGLSGLLLGTRFRAPALIVASALALFGLLATGLALEWPASRIVIRVVAGVAALQAGFGLGVLLTWRAAQRRQEAASHPAQRSRNVRLTR
ncbi:hypothetical protein SLNSH_16335 [Alsobacter soli]|uniref:Uncharacterized protein n=1 Tax=Alsobacter soli TaxID=2109933 RepID=A0A2T1HQS1_9HYPH|nr:hypothetical protein [Alsobacter soli]PSC03998.1 hypothetical protein SLNSH_16335 [Alsobacter soli]